jgi:hypothetical protein
VSSRKPPLKQESLELARLLLDSASKLYSLGHTGRARESYEKAAMIYRAAQGAEARGLEKRFAEVGALLGAAKPAQAEGRKPRVRNARA